jgi:hypothetical protein
MQTIFQKLNMKDEKEIVVLNAPQSFEVALETLSGVRVIRNLAEVEKAHFALAFSITQPELDTAATEITAKAAQDIKLWFAYPKQSSKKYRCEFNRDTGWDKLGQAGYEPVRQVAIDEDWSAVRFRQVAYIKTMIRQEKDMLSAAGKQRKQNEET